MFIIKHSVTKQEEEIPKKIHNMQGITKVSQAFLRKFTRNGIKFKSFFVIIHQLIV
jgi:hypothetical protein